jgi:phosphoribosylanthranilate isomerase
MGHLFVKICGITRLEDALRAVDSGADAIGFNFYSGSKRYISPIEAGAIVEELPSRVLTVGVFVNPEREYVMKILSEVKLGALQFSGDEPPSAVEGYQLPVFKAIHVKGIDSIHASSLFKVHAFLLDAYRAGEFGGTGRSFDWKIGRKANEFGKVIVAGGLTPENVADAVREARPYGVDVSGGVETSPGKKDHKKIETFVSAAREAHENLEG